MTSTCSEVASQRPSRTSMYSMTARMYVMLSNIVTVEFDDFEKIGAQGISASLLIRAVSEPEAQFSGALSMYRSRCSCQ